MAPLRYTDRGSCWGSARCCGRKSTSTEPVSHASVTSGPTFADDGSEVAVDRCWWSRHDPGKQAEMGAGYLLACGCGHRVQCSCIDEESRQVLGITRMRLKTVLERGFVSHQSCMWHSTGSLRRRPIAVARWQVTLAGGDDRG